jgi:2-phosphosulfolactate phosphatase
MMIDIFQGKKQLADGYDIAIVIDVIRAFTVAHYCFSQGAKHIYLVKNTSEALALKEQNPHWLLIGEEGGYPIIGFDLDNSPANVRLPLVRDHILVQRTSNGVQATLAALNAAQVLVTGFSNARTTAMYVRQQINRTPMLRIALIASDESSDDDFACALYIAGLLSPDFPRMTAAQCRDRIRASRAAQKFFASDKPEFEMEQLDICSCEKSDDFVMRLNKQSFPPRIETRSVNPAWKPLYVPGKDTAIPD